MGTTTRRWRKSQAGRPRDPRREKELFGLSCLSLLRKSRLDVAAGPQGAFGHKGTVSVGAYIVTMIPPPFNTLTAAEPRVFFFWWFSNRHIHAGLSLVYELELRAAGPNISYSTLLPRPQAATFPYRTIANPSHTCRAIPITFLTFFLVFLWMLLCAFNNPMMMPQVRRLAFVSRHYGKQASKTRIRPLSVCLAGKRTFVASGQFPSPPRAEVNSERCGRAAGLYISRISSSSNVSESKLAALAALSVTVGPPFCFFSSPNDAPEPKKKEEEKERQRLHLYRVAMLSAHREVRNDELTRQGFCEDVSSFSCF